MLAAVLLLAACGGGGGGGGGGGTPPSISNLAIAPDGAYLNSGQGQAAINGTLEYVANTSALATATIRVKDASGQVIDSTGATIQGAGAGTRGTISGTVDVSTTTLGRYTFEVFVTDTANRQSNVLTGAFRITNFPWVTLSGMPTPRPGAGVAVLGSQFYLIGGDMPSSPIIPAPAVANVEIFDAATGAWSTAAPLPVAVQKVVAAGVNGRVYVVGGRTTPYGCSQITNVYEFDPVAGTWAVRGGIPAAVDAAATAIISGKVYVFGGEGAGACPDVAVPSVSIYDPATDAWSSTTAMPAALMSLGLGTSNGLVTVFGGSKGNDDSAAVYEFNPATGAWRVRLDSMSHPQGWSHMAYATVGSTAYSVGGTTFGGALMDVSAYDQAQDRWSLRESLGTAVVDAGAGVYDGKVYVFPPGATLVYAPADDLND